MVKCEYVLREHRYEPPRSSAEVVKTADRLSKEGWRLVSTHAASQGIASFFEREIPSPVENCAPDASLALAPQEEVYLAGDFPSR